MIEVEGKKEEENEKAERKSGEVEDRDDGRNIRREREGK